MVFSSRLSNILSHFCTIFDQFILYLPQRYILTNCNLQLMTDPIQEMLVHKEDYLLEIEVRWQEV